MKNRRLLTQGEAKLARYIFKNSINYQNIEIIESHVTKHNAITPFGSVYFPSADYKADFVGSNMYSPPSVSDAHWLVHELVHVWQHYVGMSVILLAAKARIEARKQMKKMGKFAAVYGYSLAKNTDLLDYNIEQQGDIIADYYALKLWKLPLSQPTALYEQVLDNFGQDPTYPIKERWIRKVRSKVRGLDR